MSPGRGSTPWQTDLLTGSRSVILTLTLMLVRLTVTTSTSKHLLYQQRHQPAPLENATIANARCLARCSAERKEKHTDPFEGHGISAASQPANRSAGRAFRYPANATGSEQFRRPAMKQYVGVAANTNIPQK
jgi:hypothetical protein